MPDHNPPGTVDDYRNFLTIPTRWMDNDVYGHVNNVQYYSYFDTAVNSYLIDQGVLDIQTSDVIGLVVETQCRYFDGFTFPDQIRAGIRVAHIGTSSVRYEVGLFNGKTKVASAEGYFIHVYVERQTRRPTKIPAPTRAALEKIAV